MKSNQTMKKTILGFVPTESPTYRLHPMTRLVMFLAMGFIPLFIQMPEINILFLIGVLILFSISKVNLKQLKKYIPMVIMVGCFIGLTYIIFPNKEVGEEPIKLGFLTIYLHSIMWGFCIYTRILTLLFSSIFYFSTNRERDMLVGLRCLKMPFVATYFLGLTLRSAGMFMEDYKIIREAEQARGLDMTSASFVKKIKHFAMYMIPLFTLAIRRSEEISVGLYSKGTVITGKYNGKKRPDYLLKNLKITKVDIAVIILIFVVFFAIAYLQVSLKLFNLVNSPINQLLLK